MANFAPPPELLRTVQKPARYVGGEPGQVVKDPESVACRFAFCFPDAYEIGMSHLGLRILYSQLNADEQIWCERAFAPFPDMEAALRRFDLPLTTLESGTPLQRMDVLGFSLQHELCATNVLVMLDLGGVPLRAEDRREEDPLVVAGGPLACHPEPVAPFFDAVALGDGENSAIQIAHTWTRARQDGLDRQGALAELDKLEFVYVPALAETQLDASSQRLVVTSGSHAVASRIDNLDDYPFPKDGPVPVTEAVFDRAMVEIARGCCGGCRFCQAGMIYRPLRERDPQELLRCLNGQVAHAGYDEASLTSLSTADYSQIGPLVASVARELGARDVALSVSSLRAYGLDDELSEALAAVRTTSLTLAPEAATQRLRDVINKNITEEDIIRGAKAAMTASRRRIKLYFMLGLPGETDDDVKAIAELALKIRAAVAGRSRRPPQLTVSASTFVPKPHTPLQWGSTIGPDEVLHKHKLLRTALRPHRIEARVHNFRLSMLEAVLSRADRRAADFIERGYNLGARFDGWDEYFNADAWIQAEKEWDVDEAVMRGPIPLEARLPWDHLEIGPSASYLAREYRRAEKAKTTSPCLRIDSDDPEKIVCHHCGLECDLELEKSRLRSKEASAAAIVETEGAAEPQPQAQPRRYRLELEKSGDLAWIGHLDTVRLLVRLFRRAETPLAYTQGFHPKPKLSFAAPLPLGVIGLHEIVDLSLQGELDIDALLEKLRALAPPGLVPLSLRFLDDKEIASTRLLRAVDLLLTAKEWPADIEARMEAVKANPRLEVTRKKGKIVDVRPALTTMQSAPSDLLEELGLPGKGILVRTLLGAGPAIRTEDLLRWLECEELSVEVRRTALYQDPIPTKLA